MSLLYTIGQSRPTTDCRGPAWNYPRGTHHGIQIDAPGVFGGLGILLAGVVAWSQDRGAAEPAGQSRVDVFNPVEGRAVVIASRPDGTRVEKGDVICELDPSELRDRLASQDTVVLGAQAEVNGTRIGREVTVLTLIEYKQGAFKLEFATVEGEIKLAEAKLHEDRVDWSRRMFEKGYVSRSEKISNELELKQARYGLEEAQSKKKVLVDYSRGRTIKALTGAVESARSRELAAQARLDRERRARRGSPTRSAGARSRPRSPAASNTPCRSRRARSCTTANCFYGSFRMVRQKPPRNDATD